MSNLKIIDSSLREILTVYSIFSSNIDHYFREEVGRRAVNRSRVIRYDKATVLINGIFNELNIGHENVGTYFPLTITNVFLNFSNPMFETLFNDAYSSCSRKDIIDNYVVELRSLAIEIRECLDDVEESLA